MLHFYDGQIRRYLLQTIRALSHFSVKYGDGTLIQIPVVYGDADRQAAAIMRQNSENKINSTPRISVYITGLAMDKDRLGDASYVGKVHVRERNVDPNTGFYGTNQGENYTVERLMPTPFKLTMKADIWAANTDQKLQILEQILVLFNPTLELQTTDNYIDWTSLSILEITDLSWSSRSVPVGADSPIDIATLTLATPIWINPPVKVKQMGIITAIVTSINEGFGAPEDTYIDGLGVDSSADRSSAMGDLMSAVYANIHGHGLQVYNGRAVLLAPHEAVQANQFAIAIGERYGPPITWRSILDQYPGQYRAGLSKLYLLQPSNTEVSGTFALDPTDESIAVVNWDQDTYPTNTNLLVNKTYTSVRVSSPGTFDAIVDPLQKGPGSGLPAPVIGVRYLIIESIGNAVNEDGPDAWKNTNGSDFVAQENDIIEWSDSAWHVIFTAADHLTVAGQDPVAPVYQTNIYTGVQYKWDGFAWIKSFEGEYKEGLWRLRL